ncbi:MAG: CGNR zinc finger domain-containing protein [Pseudoclavibacter sp.]
MLFTSDVEASLRQAAVLVNTLSVHDPDGVDSFSTVEHLEAFLAEFPTHGSREDPERELVRMRSLRRHLRRLWEAETEDEAVEIVNEMLRRGRALPQLQRHDDYGWHVHAASDDDPLWARTEVDAAMAFVELLRADEFERVKRCAAEDCEAVLVDLSRNRSKQYCDTGNCGNRANVRAYRARQAETQAIDLP